MKKIELERALMHKDTLSKLRKRAQYLRAKYGESGPNKGKHIEVVAPLKRPPDARVETPEEARANNRDFIIRGSIPAQLTVLIPELQGKDKRALVRGLGGVARGKGPQERQAMLLEAAINNMTCVGELSNTDEKLVQDAIKRLTDFDDAKEKGKKGGRS